MRIQVLYFAVFRERLGMEGEALEVADGATVGDAIAALEARHEVVATLRGHYRVALNQSMTDAGAALTDGDELVLIPPVAGGNARHVVLGAGPLSLDRCLAAVVGPEVGGVCTFTGLVRRHSRGVTVERLEYEAYGAMAEKVMRELVDEIEAEVPGVRIAVEHRTGTLAIGDAAVVIAAAAPHRAEAFAACRAMIDRLKDRVPIWKKELGEDGAVWVGLGP
ncbi:MAG: molybdenum cofactor biosynthesis protein MoaE [Kofleriaceae bacterium]|nr:molybdenum cofactor biosynthesis protein MoaE [Kofleriaceae bacterium]MCL4225233.1 molybdenum cofactor biosynthesis protein MoaE [Myxococcales bacterium]